MSDDSSKPNHSQKTTLPAEQAARQGNWGPLAAILLVFFGYVAAQAVSSGVLLFYAHLRHWNSAYTNDWLQNSVGAQFVYVLLSESITIGILLFFLHRRKIAWKSLGFSRPKGSDALLALAGVVAYFIVFTVVVSFLQSAVRLDINQQQDIGFSHVAGAGPLVMTFVSLVVLPPFVEETLFRGFLYGGLRRAWGVAGAFVGTSVIFALPHLLESGDQKLLWIAGVDTFVLSLVLCYLRERTGKLWAGIGVHALKNGVAFLSLFILHAR